MKAFFFRSAYFKEPHKNISVVRQACGLFGMKNILTFDEAMQLHEPLFSIEALLDLPVDISILERLAVYPAPLISIYRIQHRMLAGDMKSEFPRCFDFMYALNPATVPFPSAQWFRRVPEVTNLNVAWANREYDVCFVGSPCPRKQFTLIAHTLDKYPNAIVAVAPRGRTAMPVYRVCKEWAIEILSNPPREEINRIFNSSKFLIYPTFGGHQDYNILQHSPLEGIVCNCPPILNHAWCSSAFRGYPAQVSTKSDIDKLELTKTLWEDCLSFFMRHDPVKEACRTSEQMLDIINGHEYRIDPHRRERCQGVIQHVKDGKHLFRADYKHGPFYRYDVLKTMNYIEVEYINGPSKGE